MVAVYDMGLVSLPALHPHLKWVNVKFCVMGFDEG